METLHFIPGLILLEWHQFVDLGVRGACGDGSDGNGGKDGSMGLEADSGTVSEVEGGVDGSGEAAAPAAAIGSPGETGASESQGAQNHDESTGGADAGQETSGLKYLSKSNGNGVMAEHRLPCSPGV